MSDPNTATPNITTNNTTSIDDKVIESTTEIETPQVAEVKEIKTPEEPVISSTRNEQENTVPPSRTVPLIPTENDDNNIPAAIFETISSKLNPIAQKLGKGVGQLRQVFCLKQYTSTH